MMDSRANLTKLNSKYADVWIINIEMKNNEYCYGGTRTVEFNTKDHDVENIAKHLMLYESTYKNIIINDAIKDDSIFKSYSSLLPNGFLKSNVGGARCIIRPRDKKINEIFSDPKHKDFNLIVDEIFRDIGEYLNYQKGKIKLTPDFGKYAGLADNLFKYTPHVLGIDCENGGCGGKASYTSTGISQAVKTLNIGKNKPITLIGSAGACGEGVLSFLVNEQFNDLGISDLVYTNKSFAAKLPESISILKSKPGCFTDESLKRGGVIIATTFGGELINSNLDSIPNNTMILLAHNVSLPPAEDGIAFVNKLKERNIIIFPGQILTFGGALTSRIEWFWRQSNKSPFDKNLAHSIVENITDYWIKKTLEAMSSKNLSPYEFLLNYFSSNNKEIISQELC